MIRISRFYLLLFILYCFCSARAGIICKDISHFSYDKEKEIGKDVDIIFARINKNKYTNFVAAIKFPKADGIEVFNESIELFDLTVIDTLKKTGMYNSKIGLLTSYACDGCVEGIYNSDESVDMSGRYLILKGKYVTNVSDIKNSIDKNVETYIKEVDFHLNFFANDCDIFLSTI